MTTAWTPAALVALGADWPRAPVIAGPLPQPLPGHDLWDYWPVQETDGRAAVIAGGRLIVALAAPWAADPEARHGVARLRLLHQRGTDWRDLGWLLPEGFSPGSREWSGSTIVDADHRRLTLYFTAAGRRGEARIGFDQRLFETSAPATIAGDTIAIGEWTPPTEMVAPDGVTFCRDMAGGGGIGTIKAFRDPAWFRDPATGCEHITFAASLAGSASPWNGAIGHAMRTPDGQWQSLPPLVTADGLNNELERPHLVAHRGRLLLFWSTQAKVFAQPGPAGPTGLYGAVADSIAGPWHLLNGSGLVFGNPDSAPFQAYSWLVLPDLSVLSFADLVGLSRPPADTAQARAHFAGVPAPELRLWVEGERAGLA